MTVFLHELKRNKLSLILWSAAISFMLGVCVLIYPEMSSQMTEISDMFADMGSFSAAFGMDKINFGEFMGYFGIECGNVLGIGGALFAAILGTSALSNEEKNRTAEFLLTHPISRGAVVLQKLLSVITQIAIMNAAVLAVTMLSILIVKVDADMGVLLLMFLAYLMLQIEIAAITFGISAFLRRGGLGIGLGISLAFYFMNIISNLSEDMEILKYITPFGYTEGADIIADHSIKIEFLAVGMAFAAVGIAVAFWKYGKKDIS